MKTLISNFRKLTILIVLTACSSIMAQQSSFQFARPNDKTGLNIFETSKNDTTTFTGLKVSIGGNFTQDFQSLRHQNNATPRFNKVGIDSNKLARLTNGFNLPMANLNLNVQLEDGIRMNLTMYLSSRHHPETWVKDGYIQFDKLLFLKSDAIDNIMKNFTIKIGNYEVDYGDQHFRRTDGGNSIYNTFTENYIMDEFTTEVGSEIYYHSESGLIAMGGITNGALNPTVIASSTIDTLTGELNTYAPAFHGKLGYDKQFNKDFRFRITGSIYSVKSASRNTLFWGDRTGSHYFSIMENTKSTTSVNAWSGRYDPKFSQQVSTFMINPFVKYKGAEFFGTYELANGRTITEPEMRKATQYAVDLIYRFPEETENFWIGGRYNSLTATLPLNPIDIIINRAVASLGWFTTKNMMLKIEYVYQQHKDFPTKDIRSEGKFDGVMMQASVGF